MDNDDSLAELERKCGIRHLTKEEINALNLQPPCIERYNYKIAYHKQVWKKTCSYQRKVYNNS